MNRILPAIIALLFLSAALVAVEANFTSFQAVQTASGTVTVTFTTPEWSLEQKQVDNQSFKQVVVNGAFAGSTLDTGMPELPTFTSMVAVPFGADVSFEIVDMQEEIVSCDNVWPVQPEQTQRLEINQTFYATGDVYPAESVTLGETAVLRDYRVAPITINPFRYDPATRELRVITQMEVAVRASDGPMTRRNTISRSFEPFYENFIANYDAVRSDETPYQQRSMIVVYSNDTNIDTMIDQYVEWKRDKGFDVHVLDSSTVGNTSSAIKNYIQDAYDTWEAPPEYIVIIGDVTGTYGVPCWYASGTYGEGDQGYVMLDGTDLLAEAFVGRISIESSLHFSTWLSKMNVVERQPYTGNPNFYHHSLLVGDTEPSGLSTVLTNKYIKERILSHDPTHTFDEMYNGQPSPTQMVAYMNQGTLWWNYRGYLNMSGFSGTHANSMDNVNMPVNAVINTCSSGSFATGTANTEYMMRAGTPSEPTGAFSAIGMATSGTHTQFNNILTAGCFWGIYNTDMSTMGEAIQCGKLFLWLAYNDRYPDIVHNFTYWNNLMGDPSLDIWRTAPIGMTATYDSSIDFGQGWIDISVVDEFSMPVEGAWACARSDDENILARGYTNADGLLTLRFDPEASGDASLVVTKPDYMPQLEDFTVQTSGGVFSNATIIDDDNSGDSQGNNDGEINPGETIELAVTLHNYTSSNQSGVSAVLSTTDAFVNITDDTESYGAIDAGENGSPDDDFDIEIVADAPDGHEVEFSLEITAGANTWSDKFWLTIKAGDLDVQDAYVTDGGNGMLDPSETAPLVLSVFNDGQVDLEGVVANLVSLDGLIRVDDAEASFGDIAVGQTVTCNTDAFEITGMGLLVPGMFIPFEVTFSTASGYEETANFQLEVGVVTVNDPLGPDSYGYVCYDMGDTAYIDCPEYDWIELNPSNGGPGTDTGISDMSEEGDDIVFLDLPFTFSFYGEDYDLIGICSNGYVTFGYTEQKTFRNWVVPGPLGPSPMIAVFWDELHTDDVYYWYDSTNHLYVVSWDAVIPPTGSQVEFELILYDPDHYLSSTFDGPIKMQYKVFNNDDSVNDPYDNMQGNYSTIGLEDHTELIGLQYSYDNAYPTAAAVLADETALFFTGSPVSFEESYLILGDVQAHDEDGSGVIDVGEQVELGVSLENVGLSTSENAVGVISSDDEYVNIVTANAEYGDIESGMVQFNEGFYQILVSPTCPDGHEIVFTIDCSDDTGEWSYLFSLRAYKPRLSMSAGLVWDPEGNNDGVMDPGESGLLILNIENVSSVNATEVTASLSTTSSYITINDPQLAFPDIAPDENAQRAFSYAVANDAPVGESVTFTFDVVCEGGVDTSWDFQSSIGIWGWSTDFESDDGGFITNAGWEYGQPGIGAHSGVNTWGTDLSVMYDNNADWSLYTDEYYIGPSSQLIFWHDYRTQFGHDGCNVKISTDGGGSWHLLYPDSGYNGAASGGCAGIANEPCFTGYSPGYSEVTFDLGAYSGNYCVLRFHFGSDDMTVAYGWTIDDVTITGSQDKACKLTGTLSVDNGAVAIGDTRVTTGGSTTVPLENGDWELYVREGIYDITGYAPFCESGVESAVEALQGQVSGDHALTLTYLLPPYNLCADSDINEVTLSWSFDGDAVAQRDRAVFEAFRVWRRIETGEDVLVAEDVADTTWATTVDSLINYYYWIEAVYDAGVSQASPEIPVYWDGSGFGTGDEGVPAVTSLDGNYPNPFNPETTVAFSLSQPGNVELTVYNIRGQRVRTLVRGAYEAGRHEAVWRGRDDNDRAVGSGVYFLCMKAPGVDTTRKMLLLK